MAKKKRQAAAQLSWKCAPGIPTQDFFANRDSADPWAVDEAVDDFVGMLTGGRFFTWEAVACEEQGIPLTPRQQTALDDLISLDDEHDDQVHLIDESPRPSEPWHVILNQLVPQLLVETFRTFEPLTLARHEGWREIVAALRAHGEGLSLPHGVQSPEECVPLEMRHRLWLQTCFDTLSGLGQDPELTLNNPDQLVRLDRLIDQLRQYKESVAYFGLTLDSLMTRVVLPERDERILRRVFAEKLGLRSGREPLADQL